MVELPEVLNLATVFLDHNLDAGRGARTALICGERRVSYAEVAAETNRVGNLFRSWGLYPEQRVLLMLPDVPEFASAWFATVKVGGVAAAVNPEQKPEEAEYYLNYTRARICVAHASALPSIAAVKDRLPFLEHLLVVGTSNPDLGGATRFAVHLFEREVPHASAGLAPFPTHRDDPAVWLFTSGSTGFPKGAVHKAHDFLYNARLFALPILQYDEHTVSLSVPKLAFGYALGTNLLFPFLVGATCVLVPEKPKPEAMFAAIDRHRPTMLTAVPTALNAMVNHPGIRDVDFSSLKTTISAGEALPAELYTRWKELTGVEILDGIGSAEMFHIFITNRHGDVKLGSLGRVVEGYEAKICDDEGRELPPGEVGTLWIRGDSMALEYWHQHEASKRTFRGDWCVSADKFRRDEAGYFYFCGRGDDLLKVGGKWVSPLEIENVLLRHDAVQEAAVVGFKDEAGLEKPRAVVVLKPGRAADEALGRELAEFVAGQLDWNRAPRRVDFVDALPKSDRGKVLRSALRS
ncbi:MAG: benzoate-CoA ligase family protein [Myxococcales bacterium]